MQKTTASAFYKQPWKILPLRFFSSHRVTFGESVLVEFDLKARLVLRSVGRWRKEISRLSPDHGDAWPVTSISDFRGTIAGDRFSLCIKKGRIFDGPTVVLTLFDKLDIPKEIAIERVQALREFDFGGVIRCRYLGHAKEQLEMEHEPEWEDLAQVLGAVLLQLLIATQPSAG